MAKKVPKTLHLRLGLLATYLVFVSVTTLPHAASVSFNYNFSTPGALTSPDLKVASFTSNFTFVIKPHNNTAGQGDGMTFFVGTYPPSLPNGSYGGFLGLVNSLGNLTNTDFPPTVAIEFDAFRNEWDPNNTTKHVGVDINSITSVASAALPDWCFNGSTTMSAWVRYNANTATLSATLRLDDQPGLLNLYNVSAPVDFRAEGLPL